MPANAHLPPPPASAIERLAGYDFPRPFLLPIAVAPADVDGFDHVNNAVYSRWLNAAAWAHSDHLGVPLEVCRDLDRGMAVARLEVDYLRPGRLGEELLLATWIIETDGRLRSTRAFQLVRPSDGATLIRARMHFVCVALSTGLPARMPPLFKDRYGPVVIAAREENAP